MIFNSISDNQQIRGKDIRITGYLIKKIASSSYDLVSFMLVLRS